MCAWIKRFGGSRSADGASGKSDEKDDEETEKDEPNFELSGKLTAETNTYKVHTHCTCMND